MPTTPYLNCSAALAERWGNHCGKDERAQAVGHPIVVAPTECTYNACILELTSGSRRCLKRRVYAVLTVSFLFLLWEWRMAPIHGTVVVHTAHATSHYQLESPPTGAARDEDRSG